MRLGWLVLVLTVGLINWGCDSETSGGKKCGDHTECELGNVCVDGSCAQVECTKHSECPTEFCAPAGVNPAEPDKKYCSPVFCKKDTDCDTEAGEICNQFKQCEAGGTVDTDVVEPGDVVEDDTVVIPGDKITSCIPCSKDSDCTNSSCKPLGGGTFCFEECTTNNDCPTGWMCYALSTTGKQCIPTKFNCEATCLNTPCAEGQACNQDTGECIEAKTECGACQQDWECADGYRCNQIGKYCAPVCGAGGICPASSTCQEVNSVKVSVCVSASAQCCYGETCEGSQCPADKPYSNGQGVCVQCLNDTHCTTGTCNSEGVCSGSTTCPPEKPHDKNGVCVQCLEDGHCQGGFTCQSNVCKDGTAPPECSYCVDPYPACVQINGIWSCVQCKDDSGCPAGVTCDTSLYACSKEGPVGSCGTCTSDSQCTSSQGLTLKCDTASGCCYDSVNGSCDNVEVMCKGAMACKGLLDMLMPGGGGMPGMPLPTEGMGGTCECTEPVSDMMALLPCLMGGCPASSECVKGVCLDPSLLTSLLGGGTGVPSATGLCLDPTSLLGGIF